MAAPGQEGGRGPGGGKCPPEFPESSTHLDPGLAGAKNVNNLMKPLKKKLFFYFTYKVNTADEKGRLKRGKIPPPHPH